MVAERVEFDLQPLNSSLDGYVTVTAEFVMLNRGTVDETLNVRFPLEANDFTGTAEPLDNFRVGISGLPITVTTALEPSANCPVTDCPPEQWASFQVLFPIQQPIVVRVNYELKPIAYSSALGGFTYILRTGAGWYGPIGKATILLRLPYQATRDNATISWGLDKTPEYLYNEVRLYAEAFEPRDNLGFSIIYPEVWRQLLAAQAKTKTNPKDPNAWAELGSAHTSVGARFHGGWDRRQLLLSAQAYVQAAKLDPLSSGRYSDLARIYWQLETLDDPGVCFEENRSKINLTRVLPNLSLALALNPDNFSATNLLSEVESCYGQPIKLPPPSAQILALRNKVTPTPRP